MVDYREILRLHSLGYSRNQIEASAHTSHHTVKAVLDTAESLGICWPLDEKVTNAILQDTFFPGKYVAPALYAEPDYSWIHRELAKPGVTLTLLWTEYSEKARAAGHVPYMRTQFCDKYRKWARLTKATMRIQHKPGDAMQVDWAGNTIPVYDSVTGDVSKAYVFVAVLPCSCFAYAEVCGDMKTENWLLCHVHAFEYFGGVTRLLIPDNCKTGVTANTRYETVLNRSYLDLSEHYGTAVVPARVRHPKDKSLAEGTVKFVSTWIIAALRDRKFFTVAEVQAAVAEKLEEMNDKAFQKRTGSRRTAYLNEEKDFMRPLPATAYQPSVWLQQTVGNDYLVSDGRNKYSVPFDVIGKEVNIRLTHNLVEVFFNGSRIAAHLREVRVLRDPVVNPEHMTPEHRKYLNCNAEEFVAWAAEIGPKTLAVVKYFLSAGREQEQGYKSCVSLRKLSETYSKERLEKACTRMLEISGTPSIRNITTILRSRQDSLRPVAAEQKAAASEKFAITRGAEYYGNGGKGHV